MELLLWLFFFADDLRLGDETEDLLVDRSDPLDEILASVSVSVNNPSDKSVPELMDKEEPELTDVLSSSLFSEQEPSLESSELLESEPLLLLFERRLCLLWRNFLEELWCRFFIEVVVDLWRFLIRCLFSFADVFDRLDLICLRLFEHREESSLSLTNLL